MEPSKDMQQQQSPTAPVLSQQAEAAEDLEAGVPARPESPTLDLEAARRAGASAPPWMGEASPIGSNFSDAPSPESPHKVRPPVKDMPSNATTKNGKKRGKTLARCIFEVAKPFFWGKRSSRKSIVLALLIGAILYGDSCIMMWFSYIQRGYTTALTMKDEAEFYHQMKMVLAVILIILPMLSIGELLKGTLAIEWRRHMTEGLLTGYLSSQTRAFYTLKNEGGSIDNPDQRIAQDVLEFTKGVVEFLSAITFAIITLANGAGVLANIYPILLGFAAGYSFIGTIVMLRMFGLPLTRLQRKILEQEANLRFALVRVRESAEAIAFLQGEEFEGQLCKEFFAQCLKTWYKKLVVVIGATSFKRAYTMITYVVPGLMLGPAYLRGEIDFGAIAQVGFLFGTLLEAMMTLVSQLDAIANLGAQAFRIQQLVDKIEELKLAEATQGDGFEQIKIEELENPEAALDNSENPEAPAAEKEEDVIAPLRLQLRDVSLAPPQLVEDKARTAPMMTGISLALRDGESLLICGGSGLGKSSLLRAIGGLWRKGSGSIERCKASRCFFVPQRPYMCLGTLREQVTYPDASAEDVDILKAIHNVNLGYVADRHGLDTKIDFSSVLSLGEQQRLGFARLLLRTDVDLALVDEGTSALDEENEALLYGLLREKVRCFVSVGHRSQLHQFHTHKMRMHRSIQGSSCGRVTVIGGYCASASGGGARVGI